ncbi:MAG: M20/M25/M40 family metallo-hydrolase [Vicinamibacterales bacterium]
MSIRTSAIAAAVVVITASVAAQGPLDPGVFSRIREEGLQRSQAMDHASWMADVYGPRMTGTPNMTQASEWAMKRFSSWGMANVHQERFKFGQGWKVERFSAHLVDPQVQPLIGYPRNWSPSTPGPITAEAVHVTIGSEADFARYAGKLRGKIVLPQVARRVRMLDGRLVLRMTEAEIAEALTTPIPGPGGGGGGFQAAQAFQQKLGAFLVSEGVAAVLERGSDSDTSAGGSDLSWQTQRVDGGTIFPGTGGSRDASQAAQVPSATIAVEHYNRMIRILDKGLPVRIELNIQTTFYPEEGEGNGINTIAEIPGSDLADQVVILGAHFDSTAGATGATDNATGSSAMMEAARIIQSLGLKPRRTIRIALWGGEEQGLLGSRAYVARHFGDPARGTATPDHARVAAYFNLDNGTGRIRGIWGQGNLGAMAYFRDWLETVRDLGAEYVGPRSVASTDHDAFDNVGIPGFQFMQERLEYNARSHHSNMDFLDRVQREDLVQQATVAAVFAWYAANTPEPLPRKTVANGPGPR